MKPRLLFWLSFGGTIVIIAAVAGIVALRGSNKTKELSDFYSNWKTVEGKVGSFTAKFPNQPEYASQDLPIPNSKQVLKQEIFVGNSNKMSFFATATKYPIEPKGDLETLLRASLDGVAKSIPEVQSVSGKFTVPLREPYNYLAFEIRSGQNATNYKGRIYLVGDTLYQIYATYPEGSYQDNEFANFENSFVIETR